MDFSGVFPLVYASLQVKLLVKKSWSNPTKSTMLKSGFQSIRSVSTAYQKMNIKKSLKMQPNVKL